jgi:hypothetical protein
MVIPVFSTLSQQIGAGYSGRQAESLYHPEPAELPKRWRPGTWTPIGNIFMAAE